MADIVPAALTPEAAAAYMMVTVRQLAYWRGAGSGPPFVKIGRCVRYRREAVDAWLAARQQASTAEVRA